MTDWGGRLPGREAALPALQAEAKYGPQTVFAKLKGPLSVKRLDVTVSEAKQTKYPKEIDVYYSSKEVKDVNELKVCGTLSGHSAISGATSLTCVTF